MIAPGTTGQFEIEIDGTGSEVGIAYSVAIKAADGIALPEDMVFSTGEITADNAGKKLSEFKIDDATIPYSATADDMKKTITVFWSWAFDANDDATAANDNTYADQNWTLDITVTGKQAEPTATPTA